MSAIEETKSKVGVAAPSVRAPASPLTRVLNLLSSVRFGVTLLIILAAFSMIGMLIMQTNVEGFEKYYAESSPATRLLFGTLGFYDIYHSWYFNVLLLVLSLNIVLASIDRFPGAWQYIKRPKLEALPVWLDKQPVHTTLRLDGESRAAVAERLAAAARQVGLSAVVTEKEKRTTVFMQKGAWNRLGAYGVHVALLTIFTGGFLTTQFGRTGMMQLRPGVSAAQMREQVFHLADDGLAPSQATYQLPFTVECTDIQQKLIKEDGPITADNTIDWLTKINIKDGGQTREALVHMNNPVDYRGYRFFQASFTPLGQARTITVRVTPEQGGEAQEVTIPRDGTATLADGTRVEFADFYPNFKVGGDKRDTEEGVYPNPAAELRVTRADGTQAKAYAFNPQMADNAPFAKRPVAGYTFRLVKFEKVPESHFLSIQHDPGSNVFYLGGALLTLMLLLVFFFSHRRIWAVVEELPGGRTFEVTTGGNTNRNLFALEDTFKKFIAAVTGRPVEAEES
ncbi:MAG TPA: cytochrome c biogenesis protein ResB [Pyrinomonadaceae bacterium]|jgi:cytochrome c biogenesis protein